MNLWLPWRKAGQGQSGSLGWICTNTSIFKMDNQQGPAVQHRELSSVLYSSLDGRGVWGRMDTATCVAETETISYIPIQNENFFKASGVYVYTWSVHTVGCLIDPQTMTPSSSLWEMEIHFALDFTYFSGKTIHLKQIDKILPLENISQDNSGKINLLLF